MGNHSESRYGSLIADLARPADLRGYPLPAIHCVMTMRFCALADKTGQDILPALALRFASLTAAQQALDLNDTIRRCWPEPFVSARPCCMRMTHDERTLGRLAQSVMHADRRSFDEELDGFVRPKLREALFASSVGTVAQFMAL